MFVSAKEEEEEKNLYLFPFFNEKLLNTKFFSCPSSLARLLIFDYCEEEKNRMRNIYNESLNIIKKKGKK